VFLGRPGTGKTTVCKIFGSLLRQAGALSKGHVVVCDRGTFIGTLWGDEERSVRQVLEMAQGGVLMVDEAYLLNGKHENDPGKLVVQLMMNILADETQRDIAIVLCGYKEPMEKLLESNPGLQSRFPNKFEFADFTIDELLEITRRRVREYEYEFTPDAWDKYRLLLAKAYSQRDSKTWGNARFVANQLERIYIQHATRCVKQQPITKQQLRLLTSEDILPIEVPKEKRRIGF
jgi:ATPase family associated with various cellular activities (AAA).